MASTRISRNQIDLGVCLIDVYRQPGDLYDSWDIVPYNDGNPARLPNACYGVDQPDYGEVSIEDYEPRRLFEVKEHWDVNGFSEWETFIQDEKGKVICSRKS